MHNNSEVFWHFYTKLFRNHRFRIRNETLAKIAIFHCFVSQMLTHFISPLGCGLIQLFHSRFLAKFVNHNNVD